MGINAEIVKALRNPERFDYNRDLVPIMHKHPFIGPLLAAASNGADRIEELEEEIKLLESMLKDIANNIHKWEEIR